MKPLYEKYRPRTLNEIIGQDHVVKALRSIVGRGDVPHMLFVGPPGTGKTSTAYALANELGWPIVEYNASDERGIQVVREKIKTRARARGSMVILLDEADNLTEDSQQALRRIIETSAPGVRFVLTANYESRIIDPILSRLVRFEFRKLSVEEVTRIVVNVLVKEGFGDRVDGEMLGAIRSLVEYVDGDARRALNMLQSLMTAGREVTVANVRSLVSVDEASLIIKNAVEQDLDNAINHLENLYVNNKLNPDRVVEALYQAIKGFDADPLVKAKWYDKLSWVELALKSFNCNPLVQLSGFVATVWASTHAPREARVEA